MHQESRMCTRFGSETKVQPMLARAKVLLKRRKHLLYLVAYISLQTCSCVLTLVAVSWTHCFRPNRYYKACKQSQAISQVSHVYACGQNGHGKRSLLCMACTHLMAKQGCVHAPVVILPLHFCLSHQQQQVLLGGLVDDGVKGFLKHILSNVYGGICLLCTSAVWICPTPEHLNAVARGVSRRV